MKEHFYIIRNPEGYTLKKSLAENELNSWCRCYNYHFSSSNIYVPMYNIPQEWIEARKQEGYKVVKFVEVEE